MTEETTSVSGPGRLLRQAREQAKLSQEDLASLLKLNRHTLDALERDDFAQLTESVYVRGYYRKLAKVLALPEDDLLKAYESVTTPKNPAMPTSRLILSGGDDSGSGARWGTWLSAVIAGLALGGIMWVYSQYRQGQDLPMPVAESTSMEVPVMASVVPATQSILQSPTVALAVPPTKVIPVSATAQPVGGAAVSTVVAPAPVSRTVALPAPTAKTVVVPQAVAVPPAATSAAPAVANGNGVEFTATCWAQAKDATGKVLFSRVFQPGEKAPLVGKPPFAFRVGNAEGVKVVFNGKSVDVKAAAKPDKTATFNVQ